MRYLFLLLLVGCGSSSNETEFIEPIEQSIVFNKVELGELTFRDVYYNGVIEHLNDNSWVFTSHTNNGCVDSPNTLKSKCRKVNLSYVEGNSVEGRITKVDFELNAADINLDGGLYWNIVYQDWVRIIDGDTNGNHPITTLKLKVFDNKLNLCHFDNSWQWGYDFGGNRDGDAIDEDHSLHQENTLNGCAILDIGIDYKISLVTYDSGRVVFKVDNKVISDVKYQTKHPEQETYSQHIIQFGQYWNKGFNIENDPLNRVVIRIDDLKRYEAIE